MGKLTTIGIPPGGTTGEVLKKKTGTNYDVEWGAGGGGGGSGTEGQVAYFDNTSSLVGSDAFIWDDTNQRLGVALPTGNSPVYTLDVRGDTRVNGYLLVASYIVTNLTSGSIPFINSSAYLSQNNSNLFWDDTNIRLGIGTSSPAYKLDVNGTARVQDNLTISDGKNIILDTTTGTKIGTSTSQKIGLWNTAPIAQPTTAIAEASFTENSGGTVVNVDSTFAGYTLQQIAQALKNIGILQ